MILFVFEGKRREPDIFKTLEYLYFPKGQSIICSFGINIYELYRELKDLDDSGDIVSILREKNKDNPDTLDETLTRSERHQGQQLVQRSLEYPNRKGLHFSRKNL